jgi:hypothetical protein
VTTVVQYETLDTYLGETETGIKLKEAGFVYWDEEENEGTNESKFNARGCGLRTDQFEQLKTTGIFWTKTPYDENNTYRIALFNYSATIQINSNGNYAGLSIRPIKTTTTLINGQTGTYTSNDGKVYRTICIGTQEWLADNLAETKYRNSDTIPEVTDNTAWAALTTGALCAYNNDWTNVLI